MKQIARMTAGAYFLVTGIAIGAGLIIASYALAVSVFGKTPNFWTLFIAGFGILVLGTISVLGFAQAFLGWALWKRALWAPKIGWLVAAAHVLLILSCVPYFLTH